MFSEASALWLELLKLLILRIPFVVSLYEQIEYKIIDSRRKSVLM